MQILIDGRSITPQVSGIGRYTYELTKSYIREYGINNVKVILNNPIPEFPYPVIYCPYFRHGFFDNIEFSFWLSRQKYDIYHAGDSIGPFWHNKKLHRHIITVHDFMFWNVQDFFRLPPIKKWVRRHKNKLFFKYVLRDADQIISISRTTQEDVKSIYGLDSFVLREGINILQCDKVAKLTAFRGLQKNNFFFYIGLGMPHKNIDFMVRAFLQSNTNKLLVISGKGHKVIDNPRIVYTGFITDSELDFLYRNCAAFIIPSLYEGFGLPILEALSYHCKIFSSNAGSLGEFSKEVVFFFNPYEEEELRALIENCDNLQVTPKNINEYLKKFSWKDIWEEFHRNERNYRK